MERELALLKGRIRASKRILHNTEIKAENLDASVRSAIRDQEQRRQEREDFK